MANGILQVSPAAFIGERANTLPIYIPDLPVPGANAVWDSRSIRQSVGSAVTAWQGKDGVGPTLTPSGGGAVNPTPPVLVTAADGAPAVRFTASSRQTLGAAFARSSPSTVVVVARMTEAGTSAALNAIVGSGTPTSGLGQILAVTDLPRTYAGTALNLFGQPVGTGYHVLIAVFAGDNSVIRMDGFEATGPAGSATGLALSVANYQDKFSNLEVKRIAHYPFAMTLADRQKTAAGLAVA